MTFVTVPFAFPMAVLLGRRGAVTTPNLTIIDIVGSIKHVVKLMLREILYFAIAIVLMLSAPLLFTVGMQLMVHYCASTAPTWATIYFFVAPWFCAAWMAPVARWSDVVANWQAVKMGTRVKRTMQERIEKIGISLVAMFFGLIGSYVAEFAFGYEAHRMGMIPNHLSLYFALAPFAVFAPCELLVLYRMVCKPKREPYISADSVKNGSQSSSGNRNDNESCIQFNGNCPKCVKYFPVLRLKPDAGEKETKEAYRNFVKIYHPDRFEGKSERQTAEEELKQINEAYRHIIEHFEAAASKAASAGVSQ